jgi:hypothetical protein
MKKLIILACILIGSATVLAQKIQTDKVDGDGVRMISTEFVRINKGIVKHKLSLSLSCLQFKGINKYSLDLFIQAAFPLSINKGSILLLKLGNDEVITLHAKLEKEDNIGRYEGSAYGIAYRTYTIGTYYDVTEGLLERMAKFGVAKTRIEFATGNVDEEYDERKMGKIIKKHFDLINERLSKVTKITDDF